jgi:hypothetical protein
MAIFFSLATQSEDYQQIATHQEVGYHEDCQTFKLDKRNNMIIKMLSASLMLFTACVAHAETPATASQESECLQSAINSNVPDQQLEAYMEKCITALKGKAKKESSSNSGN